MLEPATNKVKTTFTKSRNAFWEKWIGNALQFSLERRIYHSVSLVIILMSSIYAPYNLYAGLYIASVSAALVGCFFTYQYYRSRYLNIEHSSFAFGLIGIVVLGVNYFFNSGIHGSTDLIWPAYLLILITISPYQQHLKWATLYILVFVIIHYVEFQYPELVLYPFHAGKGQFIDRITIFPIPVVVMFAIITFIRESYDKEKKGADEKTLAVEESKAEILKQKEALEKSNLEKNRLMSIISHDLRTPLINIQSYLELLNKYELGTAERLEVEKTLTSSTNSTLEMLSNLLNWSKSQMEGANVHLTEVNLNELLASTLEMESIHALKKGIVFEHFIPTKISVIADVDMLQIVVRNLISNALKFTNYGGVVKITAEQLGRECKISVSDNGNGIKADKQEQLFSISTTPEYGTNNEKGVGLGLMLCKEFMERQGGRINYDSTLGKGSRFNIFIPIVS